MAIEQVGANDPVLYMNDSSPVGGMLVSYDQSDEANALVYAYDVIGNVVGYLHEACLTTSYGDGTSFVQEAFGNVLSGSQAGYPPEADKSSHHQRIRRRLWPLLLQRTVV